MSRDTCAVCGTKIPHNNESGRASKWDHMKATTAGWFVQQDGTAYCPEHVPDWVPAWREKKKIDKEREKVGLIAGYLSGHPGPLSGEPSHPENYVVVAERILAILKGVKK